MDWRNPRRGDRRPAASLARTAPRRSARISSTCNSPALRGRRRHFRVPVVAVCHSCVATWWHAVETGPLPPDFAMARGPRRRGCAPPTRCSPRRAAFAAATAAPMACRDRRGSSTTAAAAPRRGRRDPRGTALSCSPPGGCGTRARTSRGSTGPRLGSSLPVLAAGPVAGPNGARVGADASRPARVTSDVAGIAAGWHGARSSSRSARYEPFGLAVLEAAQAGCALILVGHADVPGTVGGRRGVRDADERTTIALALREALAADPDRRGSTRRGGPGAGAPLHASRPTAGAVMDLRRSWRSLRRARTEGSGGVRIAYFTHSLASCWNHGNAHFLRGVLRE